MELEFAFLVACTSALTKLMSKGLKWSENIESMFYLPFGILISYLTISSDMDLRAMVFQGLVFALMASGLLTVGGAWYKETKAFGGRIFMNITGRGSKYRKKG